MKFSTRTDWSFHENALTKLLSKKKQAKTKILDLTISNPTLCGLGFPVDFGPSACQAYSPDPLGDLKAREAVTRYYHQKKIAVESSQIFLTSSTSEAYSFLFRLLANPGDSVLVPAPGYPLFQYLSDLNDIAASTYSLRYSEGWFIDIESVRQKISSRTKAMIVVNPHNPTGHYIHPDELQAILQMKSGDNPFALISDEVFLDYDLEMKKPRISLVGVKNQLTFVLSGISKVLGLPQMKLSWIVVNGPRLLRQEAIRRLEVIADSYLSVNMPAQNRLPAWLAKQKIFQSKVRQRIIQNHRYLERRLSPFVLHTWGGWYAIIHPMKRILEEKTVLRMLDQQNVLVHPGYFFDFEDNPYFVVSLLTPASDFKEGIERIQKYLI